MNKRCPRCYRRIVGAEIAHVCDFSARHRSVALTEIRVQGPSPLKGCPSPLKGRKRYDDGLTAQQRYRQRHPRKQMTPQQLQAERERSRRRRKARGLTRRFIDRAEAKRLRAEGKSLNEIASTLRFTPQAIGRALAE